jgi:hypothetical protein
MKRSLVFSLVLVLVAAGLVLVDWPMLLAGLHVWFL